MNKNYYNYVFAVSRQIIEGDISDDEPKVSTLNLLKYGYTRDVQMRKRAFEKANPGSVVKILWAKQCDDTSLVEGLTKHWFYDYYVNTVGMGTDGAGNCIGSFWHDWLKKYYRIGYTEMCIDNPKFRKIAELMLHYPTEFITADIKPLDFESVDKAVELHGQYFR